MNSDDELDDIFQLKSINEPKKETEEAQEAKPESQPAVAAADPAEEQSFMEFIQSFSLDDIVAKYGTVDYVLVGVFWIMGASLYFPTVFGAFAPMLNDAGGGLLAVPVVALLELIPFGFLWLAAQMIEKDKAVPARLVAVVPGILATVLLQGAVLGMMGLDYNKSLKRHAEEVRQHQEEYPEYYRDY